MRVHSLRFQQGAATILMSVLVGFSITAMGLALMFNIQSAQDKQITSQAQVNAQSIAWAGSEAFRQVLTAMPAADLAALKKDNEFVTAAGAATPNKLVPVVAADPQLIAANALMPAHREIAINLRATDAAAQVGTTLQVIYGIFDVAATPWKPDGAATFFDNTKFEGTVDYKNVEAGSEVITVKGNVEFTSKITGVSSVRATGDVSLNNPDVVLRDVYANGTVKLQGDAKVVDKLVGLMAVNIQQGFAGSAFSNGNIDYKTSAPVTGGSNVVTQVAARGYVNVTNQNNLEFRDIGSLTTTTLSGCTSGTCFKNVESVGVLKADPAKLERAYSQASISCDSTSQPGAEAIAPKFTGCSTQAQTKFRLDTPTLKTIPTLQPIDMQPLPIDVWDHEEDANYLVRFDGTRSIITVKNVSRSGTALSGKFELVRSGSDGYLCPLDSNDKLVANCTVAAAAKNVFCTNGCWTVQGGGTVAGAAPYTFYLEGHVAPGVILFDGNLNMKMTPLSPAAFLAAGYIRTEGNTGQSLALNFAGPDGGSANGVALAGVCTNLANKALNLIPTNFCTPDGYDSAAADNLGNVTLMAGGQRRTITRTTAAYKTGDTASTTTEETADSGGRVGKIVTKIIPDETAAVTTTEITTMQPYSGGDIQLAAANVVYGSVLAGNIFRTEGKTTLYGYVVSSALAKSPSGAGGGSVFNDGGLGLTKNQLTAETTIDHSITPKYYKPKDMPGQGGEGEGAGTGDKVRVLRARYL
jgi:hypothetical protein